MQEKTYIYESPDGGQTVYRRLPLSLERELHYQTPAKQKEMARTNKRAQWRMILEAAETDPVLQDLLDRAEVYYELKKEH